MYPWTHFLFPFFIAEILVSFSYLNHWHPLIAGIIGILIDLDHPVEFAFVRRKFSFRQAWNNSVVSHKINGRTFIHHWLGILIVAILCFGLLFFNPSLALIVAFGYYSHILLDYIHVKVLDKSIRFREFGFSFRIPEYELVLDIFLLFGIVVLFIFPLIF